MLGALAPAEARAVEKAAPMRPASPPVPCGVVWDGRGVDVARGDRAAVGGHEQRKGKEHRKLSVLWMCLQTQINTENVELMAQVALIGRHGGR